MKIDRFDVSVIHHQNLKITLNEVALYAMIELGLVMMEDHISTVPEKLSEHLFEVLICVIA